jgi:hypothetical protein
MSAVGLIYGKWNTDHGHTFDILMFKILTKTTAKYLAPVTGKSSSMLVVLSENMLNILCIQLNWAILSTLFMLLFLVPLLRSLNKCPYETCEVLFKLY